MLDVFGVTRYNGAAVEEEGDGDGLRGRETEEIGVPLEETVAVLVEGEDRANEWIRSRLVGGFGLLFL